MLAYEHLTMIDFLSLQLGDPTVGGNLPPCPQAIQEIIKMVEKSPHAAGYVNACGTNPAREAIATYHSYPQHAIEADNVIVANGCSGALELALTALLDPGTIILVPQPGFPLYQVIAESHGASVLHYRLDPDRQWEVDIDHLEQLLMQNQGPHKLIRGIIVNNPSNPTGGVFSKSHLAQIVDFCQRHKLPIVADEVYGNLVFGNNTFHPVAQVAAELGRKVPVITASGLAKQFLLPGWRIGWIVFNHNIYMSLAEVEAGARRLAQVILGASHLAQSAIPALLSTDDPDLARWKQDLRNTLADQAEYLCSQLATCPCLEVTSPQGAMYAMIRISMEKLNVADDMEFMSLLLKEENVFVLPGSAFGMPNVFRVVFCSAKPILEQAAHRIGEFCNRHSKY
jgi:tyrosine aminotransferase